MEGSYPLGLEMVQIHRPGRPCPFEGKRSHFHAQWVPMKIQTEEGISLLKHDHWDSATPWEADWEVLLGLRVVPGEGM